MNTDKINAWSTLAAAVFAGVTLALQIADGKRDPTIGIVLVAAVLVLVFVTKAYRHYRRLLTLPFRLLLVDCKVIHTTYRRLYNDSREETRLPLSGSSWPEYGSVWTYEHITLYTTKSHLFDLCLKAEAAFIELNRKMPKLMIMQDNVDGLGMVDLLKELDTLEKALEKEAGF